jgi:uncharacterized ubiquitin-like protein YukD
MKGDKIVGKIGVTIIDATGNKEQKATLPDDAPVERIILKLVEMMKLPLTDPSGQRMSYKFHHKASGKQLSETQTLAEAGVKEGDYLRIQPEITAGDLR